ncbi:MAG: hypothetical protein SGPRY_008321 [Prymnesium sp.]
MDELLVSAGLSRLSERLSSLSLAEALALLEEGRPSLLARLAQLGLTSPPDKQAVCKAVALKRRHMCGVGLPVLVCAYSSGVTRSVGRTIMQPLLSACAEIGLSDQIVVDHHNEPEYCTSSTLSEYAARLRDTVIREKPDREQRPWVLLAHSHGCVAAYGLARLLGPQVRHMCILCCRAPTIEMLHDVFGVRTCEEVGMIPDRQFAHSLGSAYANETLLAMTKTEDSSNWSSSARETIEIARSQYMSPVGLCSMIDIVKEIGLRDELPASAILKAPMLVITTPRETDRGETEPKTAAWAELTSGACQMEQVDEAHMEVPTHSRTIMLVVKALKPYAHAG